MSQLVQYVSAAEMKRKRNRKINLHFTCPKSLWLPHFFCLFSLSPDSADGGLPVVGSLQLEAGFGSWWGCSPPQRLCDLTLVPDCRPSVSALSLAIGFFFSEGAVSRITDLFFEASYFCVGLHRNNNLSEGTHSLIQICFTLRHAPTIINQFKWSVHVYQMAYAMSVIVRCLWVCPITMISQKINIVVCLL